LFRGCIPLLDLNNLQMDNLKQLEDKEFLALVFKTISSVKPVLVEKINIQSEVVNMDVADFEIVRKHIKYDNSDANFTVFIPIADEREDPFYQVSVFSNTNDLFPPSGFFIYIGGKVASRPFGLLDVEYYGQHIERNPNDYKHLRFSNEYQQQEHFYYDFENKQYVQVSDKDLKQALFKKSKGESLENLLPEVQAYLHREELFRYLRVRLKNIGKAYIREFLAFKPYWKAYPGTIEEISIYFKKYYNFLKSMDLGLRVKLLLSRMTEREYEKLLEERDRQYHLMDKGIQLLEEIEQLMKENSYYRKSNLKTYNLSGLYGGSPEKERYTDFINNVLNEIKGFLISKDDITSGPLDGYIGYDLERGELYPNIAQLEYRDALRTKTSKVSEERDMEMKIINSLRKKAES
jgi:hypothetical protein